MIRIENGVPRHPDWRMAEPVNLEILKGEQVAIVGDNGSGKSRLVEILTGHYPLLQNEVHFDFSPSASRLVSENMKYITFRDSYGEQDGTYYYQQRWNHHDTPDDSPTVGQLLPATPYAKIFHLEGLREAHIISLSSGELRKFQIAKALATNPRLLILDNPFIGLDAPTRDEFRRLLETLIRETGLQVILVLSRVGDIPSFITHVVPVQGLKVLPKVSLAAYIKGQGARSKELSLGTRGKEQGAREYHTVSDFPNKPLAPCPLPLVPNTSILRFKDVTITYGGRTILGPLDWTVNQGERWALSGPNGSGKSTLLSLVCADNPMGYACNIELFGRKRGTGESIWEIKRHIGYVSPEMHRAYRKDIPAIDVVASGLHDSVGLYVRPRPEQRQTCLEWMRVFGIDGIADRSFLRISSGEQRLCLLARAFVKDPDLLILDEPLHGLDDRNCQLVRHVIESFCQREHKTLVMVTHYEEELPSCITHHLRLKKLSGVSG